MRVGIFWLCNAEARKTRRAQGLPIYAPPACSGLEQQNCGEQFETRGRWLRPPRLPRLRVD